MIASGWVYFCELYCWMRLWSHRYEEDSDLQQNEGVQSNTVGKIEIRDHFWFHQVQKTTHST